MDVYTYMYIHERIAAMATTRIFKSGNSQAVRIPQEFKFSASEVEIFRRGDELILREVKTQLAEAFKLLVEMPDDFMSDDRIDSPPQKRDSWL